MISVLQLAKPANLAKIMVNEVKFMKIYLSAVTIFRMTFVIWRDTINIIEEYARTKTYCEKSSPVIKLPVYF